MVNHDKIFLFSILTNYDDDDDVVPYDDDDDDYYYYVNMNDPNEVYHVLDDEHDDDHDVLLNVRHVPINFQLKLLYQYHEPVDLYIRSKIMLSIILLNNRQSLIRLAKNSRIHKYRCTKCIYGI